MKRRTKIFLAIIGAIALLAFMMIRQMMGFDAAKENPRELFKFYIQKEIPPGVEVHSAYGHANFGGTWIVFRLAMSRADLEALIASKRLRRQDPETMQKHLFLEQDLAKLARPEFYWTDADTTWSSLGTAVKIAADGAGETVLYFVFSP